MLDHKQFLVRQVCATTSRNLRCVEEVAGVVRGFCFESDGARSSSGVDVAAEGAARKWRRITVFVALGLERR